jgi:hypothetical protein
MFQQAARQKFGIRKKPRHVRSMSWGELYVFFSSETCHLCPAESVAAGAYYASAGFAEVDPSAPLTLFPVCGVCVSGQAELPAVRRAHGDRLLVVAKDAVPELALFQHVQRADVARRVHELAEFEGRLLVTRKRSRAAITGTAAAHAPRAEAESAGLDGATARRGKVHEADQCAKVEVVTLDSLVRTFDAGTGR